VLPKAAAVEINSSKRVLFPANRTQKPRIYITVIAWCWTRRRYGIPFCLWSTTMAKQIAASRGGRDTSAGSPRVLNNRVTETRGCVWPPRLHPLYILVFPSIRNERVLLAVPLLFRSCHRPSRIIRPSGITNDVERAPKAPFLRTVALACPPSIVVPSALVFSPLSLPLAFPQVCSRGAMRVSLDSSLRSGLSPTGYRDNPAERRFNWIIRTARQKPANGS